MHFNYCPKCGSKLIKKEAGDDGLIPFCTACNEYYFDIFPSCVIVMTYNEFDEIALCRQGYMSDIYYNITSGFMEVGETAEEAAIREVKVDRVLRIGRRTQVGVADAVDGLHVAAVDALYAVRARHLPSYHEHECASLLVAAILSHRRWSHAVG